MHIKDLPSVFGTLDEAYKPMIIEAEELQRIMEQIDVDGKSLLPFSAEATVR